MEGVTRGVAGGFGVACLHQVRDTLHPSAHLLKNHEIPAWYGSITTAQGADALCAQTAGHAAYPCPLARA